MEAKDMDARILSILEAHLGLPVRVKPVHRRLYKAGRESWLLECKPVEPWDREQSVFEDGKQAGRREAVEWIQQFEQHGCDDRVGGIHPEDCDCAFCFCPSLALWQAKLKEWGG